MPSPVQLLGFAGSLRQGSYNRMLLRLAGTLLPPDVGLEIFDLAPIPLYNGDVEDAGMPPAVAAFRARIQAADGLLIATPEYNYSIPGVLKNALDWASRPPSQPLDGKPYALVGTGGGFGTTRAQLHLRQIAVNLNMLAFGKPELMVANAWTAFDASGNLVDPEKTKALAALVAALATFVRRLRGEPS